MLLTHGLLNQHDYRGTSTLSVKNLSSPVVRSRISSKCFAIIAYARSRRKFHVVPSKSGWKLFSVLVNVKIINSVLQRTIFDVSFPIHERKAANNSKTAQFRGHYQLPAAAILSSFALITHDPPTSAKSSNMLICTSEIAFPRRVRRRIVARLQ